MEFKDLTDEQKERAKAITSKEELVAFAEEEGIELTDEQLDAMSGGDDSFHWFGGCHADCEGY